MKIRLNFFFLRNNFIVSKNANIMGSLEFGGLSNYWGLQIDQNIFSDIKCLSKKNNLKVKKSFLEIANKIKFLGKFKIKDQEYLNDFLIINLFEFIKKRN